MLLHDSIAETDKNKKKTKKKVVAAEGLDDAAPLVKSGIPLEIDLKLGWRPK